MNLTPNLEELALLPAEEPWSLIRGIIAKQAVADKDWVTRQHAASPGEPLEKTIDNYPITIPSEMGTSAAKDWVTRKQRDLDLTWTEDTKVKAAKGNLDRVSALTELVLRFPLLLSLLLSGMLALWATRSGHLEALTENGMLFTLGVILVPVYITLRVCSKEAMTLSTTARVLTASSILCLMLLTLSPVLGAAGMLVSLIPIHYTRKLEKAARKPLRVQKGTFSLDEIDDTVVRECRMRAANHGIMVNPLSDIDRAAVIIGTDIWMFALQAQTIRQAAWFGPATLEAASCLMARAAGQGREGMLMPGLVAKPGDFRGIDRRCRLWKAWLAANLEKADADKALARVMSDLAGNYDDRVSMVARYLAA